MPRKLPFGNTAGTSKKPANPVGRTPKSPKAAPAAPVATLSLPACKYGAQCYQVNTQHLANFSHHSKVSAKRDLPVVGVASAAGTNGDDHALAGDSADEAGPSGKGSENEDSADVDEDSAEELNAESAAPTPTISLPKPKAILADGDTRQVTSQTSSATYTIKRTGDHYYCTCPAWRNQGGAPVDARSCKHLKQLLGEEYENARCLLNGGPPPGAPSTMVKRKGTADPAAGGPAAKKAKAVAPPLLLAQSWNIATGIDPTGWWISEKLDGVRAYWDPNEKKIFSRLGNAFTAPEWFLNALPTDMSLDGELFVGRKQFSQTVSIVKTHNSTKWHSLAFHVFDAPSLGALPFEARQAALAKFVATVDPGIVKLTEQTRCKDRQHVLDMLKKVEALGAEGLMLRQPASSYEGKRSKTLLKVKTFFDAEAEVIGYEPGKGRNKGVCGALKVVMESGKPFKIGTGLDDDCRRNPPPVGSIVTYRFQELTQDKVPRFPSYVGLRVDCVAAKDYVFP
ncbi:hypothetical protein HDU87_007875 [Geranomyces variabilis]|uniref:SWIM-type domain-containing protein n=1 Tax=Geranomyces variabilis TaxID=109894 RepID=A0AAD5TFR5_9FUNG|nr:hypothetical protein HDU87_007875 [Geranomyces variabilis]